MSPVLIAAAVRLARVLEDENRALQSLDMPGAARMLADKQAALGAFVAAQASQRRAGADSAATQAAMEHRALAEQLGDLAATNKRLLERAIAVQGRLVGMVAQAAARSQADGPSYRPPGARTAQSAWTLSTRA